jgi:IS30 family transposase
MFSIQGLLTCQSKLLMTYKHLSQAERYQIYVLMKAGHDQSQIAKVLDRNKSTISRELSRNTVSRGYRSKQACEMSTHRSQNSRNASTIAPWVKEQANALLRVQWSPEQIASKLPISHETVYQHVYADKAQGERFGRTCAARSKRENAMRADGTAEGKSPTDGL